MSKVESLKSLKKFKTRELGKTSIEKKIKQNELYGKNEKLLWLDYNGLEMVSIHKNICNFD